MNIGIMLRFIGVLLIVLPCIQSMTVRDKRSICEVRDKQTSVFFNFTHLSKTSDDYIIKDDKTGDSILLQLCGPLHKPCNGEDGYSICLIRDGKEIGIGKKPEEKNVLVAGQFDFKFTGDSCKEAEKYTVHIIMKCDNEDNNNSQPEMFPHDRDVCTFYILWKTKAACSEEHIVSCTTADKAGNHYDLSSLMLRSDNYVISADDGDASLILNVCHSVNYNHEAICEPKTGVCFRTMEKGEGYIYRNFGDIANPPYFDEDRKGIILKFDTGEMCVVPGQRNHVQSEIFFSCDYHATDTMPIYMGESDKCLHEFAWKTAAACSIESLKIHSEATAGKCKITNPLTNIEYNLQDLMLKNFDVKTANGVNYKFGVCGSVSSGDCGTGAGACLTKNKTIVGVANTNLMWSEGGPYLNYTGGAPCGKDKNRYTVIAFFCGVEGSNSEPVIMEDQECALIIHWNTELVCDNRIPCRTSNSEFNLMPLIRTTDNYVLKANDTEFHINICRPLVPKPYLTCLHGSAACRVIPNANGEFSNETSLGYPKRNIELTNDTKVILHYDGGSPCLENTRQKIATNLIFICDNFVDIGSPLFKYYQNCTYTFEWRTAVVCPRLLGKLTTDCVLHNRYSGDNFNLSSLREKPVHTVKTPSGDLYKISVCAGNKFCNGSAVCKGEIGYGSSLNVILDYQKTFTRLKYSNGSKCMNDFYTSELEFTCDESSGIGEPKLVSEFRCNVVFEWKTKVVCENEAIAQVPIKPPETKEIAEEVVEEAATGHAGTNIGIAIFVACCVALIIYLWSPERRARLRTCFKSLTTQREPCRAQYTKVNATEEARLLLDITDSTQCQTDSESDDDILDA